jgi:hypothetical protein
MPAFLNRDRLAVLAALVTPLAVAGAALATSRPVDQS